MAEKRPLHTSVFFTRTVRVRKEHISGEPAATDANDLMLVVERGTTHRIVTAEAFGLIDAGSALEDKQVNREEIAKLKEDWSKESKSAQNQPLKKAA